MFSSAFTNSTNMIDFACQFFKCDKSRLKDHLLAKKDNSRELRQFIDLIKRK